MASAGGIECLDIVVNNAGSISSEGALDCEADDWRHVYEVNSTAFGSSPGPRRDTWWTRPSMESIINIASVNA